jgi:hypothetical protein
MWSSDAHAGNHILDFQYLPLNGATTFRWLTFSYVTNSYIGIIHSLLITQVLKIIFWCKYKQLHLGFLVLILHASITFLWLKFFTLQILTSTSFIHCWLHKTQNTIFWCSMHHGFPLPMLYGATTFTLLTFFTLQCNVSALLIKWTI